MDYSIYFKKDFYYNASLVEKYIKIIQTSKNPKRVKAFKNLVFKMMKDIVKKNVANYINLLRNTDIIEMPSQDEIVAICYVIFDKCVNKFMLGKGYNFYFYYNKSLSRNFFRDYQRELQHRNSTTEITEVIYAISNTLHSSESRCSVDLLMEQLGFTDMEMRVCKSRLIEQKTSEFLKQNTDISNSLYSKTLKSIKEKIKQAKENKDI